MKISEKDLVAFEMHYFKLRSAGAVPAVTGEKFPDLIRLARLGLHAEKLEAVAEAAKHFLNECDCGCQCGYYTEDATEETGMNICGACATKEALAALPHSCLGCPDCKGVVWRGSGD